MTEPTRQPDPALAKPPSDNPHFIANPQALQEAHAPQQTNLPGIPTEELPTVEVPAHTRAKPTRTRTLKEPTPEQPDGRFTEIGLRVGRLVDQKNRAYGDSFAKAGEFLTLLYPNGIQPAQYGDALALVRIFDKQMRIATDADAFGESPFFDIAGYGLLGVANHTRERK